MDVSGQDMQMQLCTASDEQLELTVEEKILIRDLVIKEVFCQKGRLNNKTEYRCFQRCEVCKEQSDHSENSTLDAMVLSDNCNDFTLNKENRQKIIKQMVHEFFEQKWRANMVKRRLLKIKKSYSKIPLTNPFKANALKTHPFKTIGKSKMLNNSHENKFKSIIAINKEDVASMPNKCNVDVQNQPIENETTGLGLCVSKGDIIPMVDKNSSEPLTEVSNSNLLKNGHENKVKSSNPKSKEAIIGNKCNVDLQNQSTGSETQCRPTSKTQIVPMENVSSGSLTVIPKLNCSDKNKVNSTNASCKEAINGNKFNVDLQNQSIGSETLCAGKTQIVPMEDENSSGSLAVIPKSTLLKRNYENKLKSTVASKIVVIGNKNNVDLQKQQTENETCVSQSQIVHIEDGKSSGLLTVIPQSKLFDDGNKKTITPSNTDTNKGNGNLQLQRITNETQFVSESQILPMDDKTSPFYIDKEEVDISIYQEGLDKNGWNPTQVLYEICSQCKWNAPEFNLVNFFLTKGFLFSVTVNNTLFVAKSRAQTKKLAKHFASTECLAFIGFQFSYKNSQATVAVPSARQILGPDYRSPGFMNRVGGRYNFIDSSYSCIPTVGCEMRESQVISGDGTGFSVKRYKTVITRQNYLKYPL